MTKLSLRHFAPSAKSSDAFHSLWERKLMNHFLAFMLDATILSSLVARNCYRNNGASAPMGDLLASERVRAHRLDTFVR
jgi:hypothetical protein